MQEADNVERLKGLDIASKGSHATKIEHRVKSYQQEYEQLRRKNLKGSIADPLEALVRKNESQVNIVDELTKGQQPVREHQRGRKWGRPIKSIDDSRGQPMASQAQDTFDDILLQFAKQGYQMPQQFVSVFKGNVSRTKRQKILDKIRMGAPVGQYSP